MGDVNPIPSERDDADLPPSELGSAAIGTAPSTDVAPDETPIYVGVNGMPARPPIGPQFVCPYCGGRTSAMARCDQCRGPLDPLSRQATQNTMGPWFIRDEGHPFRPGCNYATLTQLIQRSKVALDTVMRGPTTRQFWMPARRVPGVAHLLGVCHSCQNITPPEALGCGRCGASFVVDEDRQNLGLGPVHLLPGQAPADRIASASLVPSPAAPLAQNPAQGVAVPPIVSAAGTPASSVSRDRARMDRLEREAGALKLSFMIAACAVVVLLAAFMLVVLDARLGLGLGIAVPRAAVATPTSVAPTIRNEPPHPAARVEAQPPTPPVSQEESPADAKPIDAAQAVYDACLIEIAKDTPEALAAAIKRLATLKTSDAALTQKVADTLAAARTRLDQLAIRKGL